MPTLSGTELDDRLAQPKKTIDIYVGTRSEEYSDGYPKTSVRVTLADYTPFTVDGGGGNDRITAGLGHATLKGGEGFDTLRFDFTPDRTLSGPGVGSGTSSALYTYVHLSTGVTVDLGAGTASFAGFDRYSIWYYDSFTSADHRQTFPVGGLATSWDISGFEAVQGTPYADTILGSDTSSGFERFVPGGAPRYIGMHGSIPGDPTPLEITDTVDGRGGIDILDLTGFDFDSLVIDLAVGTGRGSYRYTALGKTHSYTDNYTLRNVEGVEGSSADDIIKGDDGNNIIDGFAGADTLNGRGGTDLLDFYRSGSAPFAASGVSVDMKAGTAVDPTGATDGFRNFENVRGTARGDTIKGDNAANRLMGLDGDDVLIGQGGADTLEGAAGDDRVEGGGGDDTLYGAAGDDKLIGGAGNDVITAGPGDDVINGGGGGRDYLYFLASGPDVGITLDIGKGTATDAYGGTDSFKKIEVFGGTDAADTLVGGASGDEIYGHGGDDTLDGGTGADLLFGGAGDDTIRGGKGDDRIEGGDGLDTLTGGRGADTFVLDKDGDVDIITDFEFGVDRIELRSGDAGGGNPGMAEAAMSIGSTLSATTILDSLDLEIRLDGRKIALLPEGLEGLADYFQRVEAGKGAVTLGTEKGDAIDAKRGSPTFGLSGTDVITGTGRSDLIFGNGDADQVQGKGGPDILIGGAGDNALYGGGGNDLLVGDEDLDLILGGAGRDTLIGGAGHDRLAGGGGRDVFVISNNSLDTRPVPDTARDFEIGKDRIDLSGLRDKSDALTLSDIGLVKHAGKFWLTTPSTIDSAGHDRMARINFSGEDGKLEGLREKFLVAEHFIFKGGYGALISGRDAAKLLGTTHGDLILGNGLKNSISGGKGADTLLGGASGDRLKGGAGQDVLSGGFGNDRLEGGSGDDILEGGDGDDRLIGGPGDDKLIGGPGSNRLTGGPGADEFHFSALRTIINSNRITDFEPGIDKIVIDEDLRDDLEFTIADGEVTISGKGFEGVESSITFDYLEAMDLLLRGAALPEDL